MFLINGLSFSVKLLARFPPAAFRPKFLEEEICQIASARDLGPLYFPSHGLSLAQGVRLMSEIVAAS
jgi:hypothetical protein